MIGNANTPDAGISASIRRSVNTLIVDCADRELRATGHQALRDVQVAEYEGIVVLKGRVPSYYLKQLAQAAVQRVPGVYEVRNDLEIG